MTEKVYLMHCYVCICIYLLHTQLYKMRANYKEKKERGEERANLNNAIYIRVCAFFVSC